MHTPFTNCTFILVMLLFFSTLTSAQDTISITLNPSMPGKKIPKDFAGLSFEKSNLNKGTFTPHKDTLIRFFNTLGLQSMRIGANSADKDTFGINATSTHFTQAEIDSLFGFIQQTGCKVVYGLNFGGNFNPSLAATEANYVMQHYNPFLWGLEVGNEPDLYHSNGFRPPTYNYAAYKNQFNQYFDTIRYYNPASVFTGPAPAWNFTNYTLPFCRTTHGQVAMITQHYYVGPANAAPIRQQIDTLLSSHKRNALISEAHSIVQCADSAGVPFRMAECNSFYGGGQYGVSNALASAVWGLDYMYTLASLGCAGVNFHGGMGGAYTAIAKKNNMYTARPLYYGILAFQLGSKGKFIPTSLVNNHINFNAYSVIDSLQNVFVTLVNKDTLTNAVVNIHTGTASYTAAEYVTLSGTYGLRDTTTVSLGGQFVTHNGIIPPYTWQPLTITSGSMQVNVPFGSAAVIKLAASSTGVAENSIPGKKFSVYPNPVGSELMVRTNVEVPFPSLIEIIDLSGRKILSSPIQQMQSTINVGEISPGLYLMRITGQRTILYQAKIIKE